MNNITHVRRIKSPCHALTAVGIDVAKATLSVCVRSSEGGEHALTLRNIETDIRSILLPRIKGCAGRIVLESTGQYHWSVALLLAEAGHDIRVVNPLLSHQYTAGTIRKVKTDPADASALARMALVADNLPARFTLSREKLRARKKLSTIASMNHQLQALTASLNSLAEAREILDAPPSLAETQIAEAIRMLRRSLAQLEKEFVKEAGQDEAASRDAALLTSIPGVSLFCAQIALHWFERTGVATEKSWVAYAGLDVSSRESGTWRGRCRLTKRGNAFLRKRLYAAAWGAMMHDPQWKEYYDALKQQGRNHVEALIIIARKIVRTMYVLLNHQEPYDASKFSCGTSLSLDKSL